MTQRTSQQNRALHLDCKLIADALNDAGLDMRVVLKPEIDIPWTTQSVKEFLWKPIQKSMTLKTSTTELSKAEGEFEKIHDVLMRHLGEKHGIEYHEFPHDKEKANQRMKALEMSAEQSGNYPKYDGPPKI